MQEGGGGINHASVFKIISKQESKICLHGELACGCSPNIHDNVQGEMVGSGECLKGDVEQTSVLGGDASTASPMQVQDGNVPLNYVYT
jgi:hypothetical protein